MGLKNSLRVSKNLVEVLCVSAIICFLITFSLIIINAIMGIFIGLDYYLMIFSVLTIGITVSLTLLNSKKIFFGKSNKHKMKAKNTNTKIKSKQTERIKRKIS